MKEHEFSPFKIALLLCLLVLLFAGERSTSVHAQDDLGQTVLSELVNRLGMELVNIAPEESSSYNPGYTGYYASFKPYNSLYDSTHYATVMKGTSGAEWAKRQADVLAINATCRIERVDFHGMSAHRVNCMDRQKLLWGSGPWGFEAVAFDANDPLNVMDVAETLYQIANQHGMITPEAVQPQASAPKLGVQCKMNFAAGKPFIFEAAFTQDNVPLSNAKVLISGHGEFGRLFAYDNPATSTDDWIALADRPAGYILYTDANGQVQFPAMLNITTATVPITPQTPLVGGVDFVFEKSKTDGSTEKLSAGSCGFSIDYVGVLTYYEGGVGYDPAGDAPARAMVASDKDGKLLPLKYQPLYVGDKILVGITGDPDDIPIIGTRAAVIIQYIDGTSMEASFGAINQDLLTHYGQVLIQHKITASSQLFPGQILGTWAMNETAGELIETGLKLLLKSSPNPTIKMATILLADIMADTFIPVDGDEGVSIVRLKSIVEIRYEPQGIQIRTFEGEPDLVSWTNVSPITVLPGYETWVSSDGRIAPPSRFDVNSADQWWIELETEQAKSQGVGESQPPSGTSPGAQTPFSMPSWILWAAIPSVFCFGASFIVLVAGVFTKNKRVSTLGIILIAVVICVTTIAAAFYAGSQLMSSKPANSLDNAPMIPPPQQEIPFPDAQPTVSVPADVPPTLAPVVPAIVPTEEPHSQEVYPEPTVYNFATCPSPCLGDLSNRQSTFPEKTERLYLRFNYDWIPPGSDYVRLWKNGGQEWVRYQCKWDGPESGVFETDLREPAGFRSGEWTMEIYVNGQLVAQNSFTVQGNYTYWDPAGTINRCK